MVKSPWHFLFIETVFKASDAHLFVFKAKEMKFRRQFYYEIANGGGSLWLG